MKKLKAVTFSYDDGVQQDKRLIELFDKYSLKCTFNINSGALGMHGCHKALFLGNEVLFNTHRISADEIKDVYENHEVAAHTVSHPILPALGDDEIIYQVGEDAKAIEKLTRKKVNGFAYPGGYCEYYNERVKQLIKDNTNLYYGRTAKSSYSFDIPKDLMMFHPTVSHCELETRDKLAKVFAELETDKPQILYVWGHSYELDVDEKLWTGLERFFEFIAGRNDIFYGTNDEVFNYFGLK